MSVTRLAPSPTGALHLGNARTFLINWLMAKQNKWKIVLRIEDIDGPRIKGGADEQAIGDLRWLGIDWDEGPIYQSARTTMYREAVDSLIASGKAYPCVCSRKEIELAASAPHAEDGSAVYPGTCRGRFKSVEEAQSVSGKPPAIRFNVTQKVVSFLDCFAGPQRFEMAALGDFVIAKADGTPAYQLAVVLDDATMGVKYVIRGDDLIDSTPRQLLLYRAFGIAEKIPAYFHLPLVVGEDGRRLAKRHGDTRLSHYRETGVSSNRVLAYLARTMGIEADDSITIDELRSQFWLDRVPQQQIVFTPTDGAWLRS